MFAEHVAKATEKSVLTILSRLNSRTMQLLFGKAINQRRQSTSPIVCSGRLVPLRHGVCLGLQKSGHFNEAESRHNKDRIICLLLHKAKLVRWRVKQCPANIQILYSFLAWTQNPKRLNLTDQSDKSRVRKSRHEASIRDQCHSCHIFPPREER